MALPSILKSLGPLLSGSQKTEKSTRDVISQVSEDGFLGLYFAAEWAPNSSAVTDTLSTLCHSGRPLSVVVVSSDQDEAAFERQLESMPWPAVPFSHIRTRLRLLRQYRVSSLPFLVLISLRSGRCVSRVGRDTLLRDPDGSKFPWTPRSIRDILNRVEIVDAEGKTYEELKDGFKAIYFSASWCPPCKAFTPQLISTYNAIKSRGHRFEILFVTSDRSELSWKSYHATMPWLSVHWKEESVRKELAEALEVEGIPTLVLLDSDMSVITREGRTHVNEDPDGEGFPWRPQSVEFLKEFHMPIILDRPTVILFTDGEQSELQFAKDVLLPVAEEYFSNYSDEAGMSLKFFVAGEDEVSDGVRDLAHLDDVVPLLTIIDLAEGVKYLLEKGVQISNATVYNFVTRYTKEELSAIPVDEGTKDSICEEDDESETEERTDEQTNKLTEV